MKVYHVSADDVGPIGDLFVKARNKKEARNYFAKYFVKDLTEESLDEVTASEDLSDFQDLLVGKVEEEH